MADGVVVTDLDRDRARLVWDEVGDAYPHEHSEGVIALALAEARAAGRREVEAAIMPVLLDRVYMGLRSLDRLRRVIREAVRGG